MLFALPSMYPSLGSTVPPLHRLLDGACADLAGRYRVMGNSGVGGALLARVAF
jgi:hypothetical protein